MKGCGKRIGKTFKFCGQEPSSKDGKVWYCEKCRKSEDSEISQCKSCHCMTKTIKGKCGKCGAEKVAQGIGDEQ